MINSIDSAINEQSLERIKSFNIQFGQIIKFHKGEGPQILEVFKEVTRLQSLDEAEKTCLFDAKLMTEEGIDAMKISLMIKVVKRFFNHSEYRVLHAFAEVSHKLKGTIDESIRLNFWLMDEWSLRKDDPVFREDFVNLMPSHLCGNKFLFKNFKIFDQGTLKKIFLACASFNGYTTAKYIKKMPISCPQLRLEMAKTCMVKNWDATHKIDNFGLTLDQKIELAFFLARKRSLYMKDFHYFGITDLKVIYEIDKLIARKRCLSELPIRPHYTDDQIFEIVATYLDHHQPISYAVPEYVKNSKLSNQSYLVNLAKRYMGTAPSLTKPYTKIKDFNITDSEELFEIAKIAIITHPLALSKMRQFEVDKNFSDAQKKALVEIASDKYGIGYFTYFDVLKPLNIADRRFLTALAYRYCDQAEATWVHLINSFTITDPVVLLELVKKIISDHNQQDYDSYKQFITRLHRFNHELKVEKQVFERFLVFQPEYYYEKSICPFKLLSIMANNPLETKKNIYSSSGSIRRLLKSIFIKESDEVLKDSKTLSKLDLLRVGGYLLSKQGHEILDNVPMDAMFLEILNLKNPPVKRKLLKVLLSVLQDPDQQRIFTKLAVTDLHAASAAKKMPKQNTAASDKFLLTRLVLSQFESVGLSELKAVYRRLCIARIADDDQKKAKVLNTLIHIHTHQNELTDLNMIFERLCPVDHSREGIARKTLRNAILMSALLQSKPQSLNNPKASLDDLLMDIFKDLVPLESLPNFSDKFEETLGKFRQFQWVIIYAACLNTLTDKEAREKSLQLYGKFLHSVLDKKFPEFRKDLSSNPHLTFLNENCPEILTKWHNFSEDQFKETNINDMSHLKVCLTNDPCDYLMSGTEILNSCLSVTSHIDTNRCLLGAIANGAIRLAVIKDASGKIISRAFLRLLWDKHDQCPVLFREKIYSHGDKDMDEALIAKCQEMASLLDIPYASSLIPYKNRLHAFGGPALYEHSDQAGGLRHNGRFTI